MLFDMDGTLVDSTRSVESIWTQWAARHGIEIDRLLSISHGRRTLDTLRDVAPHLDIEAEARMLEEEEVNAKEGVMEVPGARTFLARLPGERWSVVTSASRPLAEARLRMAALPVPSVLVGGADVIHGKPNPEGYLKAAAALGFVPQDCLVLEDTPAGIQAGRSAGMQILALTTTYSVDRLLGAACIPDFRHLNVSITDGFIHLRQSFV